MLTRDDMVLAMNTLVNQYVYATNNQDLKGRADTFKHLMAYVDEYAETQYRIGRDKNG